MIATTVGYVRISYYMTLPDGVFVAEAACLSNDYFNELPDAIEFRNNILGKSGWNSDIGKAYYRSDVQLAKIVNK
jgi:hypothetical protein